MRPIEKINLVDKIGRELQSRYSYEGIDEFLAEFGVSRPQDVTVNSKWIYSKAALRGVSTDTIIRIAEELEIVVPGSPGLTALPPRNWTDTRLFRLFISHVSKDKNIATRLKECLAPHGIAGFVAHEDIHPTLEWQVEIERALKTMDAFIAVHTEGFSKSVWTQQEVGYALGRGSKIVSFKMGEDPTGFISRQQALARKQRSAEAIAKEIVQLLGDDPRTVERLNQANAACQAADL
jgi:hypothetical protein